jgi:hypothetical protein
MPISHAPNSNRLIVYGGLNRLPQTHSDDDTWVLTHANGQGGTPAWISLNPKGALPPPRQSHASGYDSRHNRFVAVMGVSEDANLPAQFLNDTWVLKNASGNCTAGQACNYDVDATDPDVGDVLTYALVSAPQGMSIDPATGLIQWTPAGNQAGDHTIIVEAVDQGGLIGTQTFTLTVEGVAVPNVQGLAPEWADAMFQAAGLNSGAKTSLGGAITLNFDTLPSEQGWVYAGAYLGVPIQTGQGWTYRPASPVVPEGQVFSVNNGALFQNSIGVGYDAEVGHRYDFLGGLR